MSDSSIADRELAPVGPAAAMILASVEWLLGERQLSGRVELRRTSHRGGGAAASVEESAILGAPSLEALGLRVAGRLAGKSSGTLNFHFPSRAALVAGVAAEGFRRLTRALNANESEGDGWPRLAEVAMRYAIWAGERPALWAAMYDPSLAADLEIVMQAGSSDDPPPKFLRRFKDNRRVALKYHGYFADLLTAKAGTLRVFREVARDDRASDRLRDSGLLEDQVNAVVAMADGLAWQLVTERQGTSRLLQAHVRRCLSLLVEGLAR